MPSLSLSGGEGLMRKQPAQIVTNKRSPVVHVSTEVPRPLGEAFEDIARANGITKAELLRRLIQALVETMKRGKADADISSLKLPFGPARGWLLPPPIPLRLPLHRSTSRVLRLEPVEGARTLPRAPREAHAMKTTSGWSAKLTRSIVLKDGTRLVTLGDVRAFILRQPEHIQERGSWQHAAELMILAAERGGSIEAATTQIEDALFLEARYVRQWH